MQKNYTKLLFYCAAIGTSPCTKTSQQGSFFTVSKACSRLPSFERLEIMIGQAQFGIMWCSQKLLFFCVCVCLSFGNPSQALIDLQECRIHVNQNKYMCNMYIARVELVCLSCLSYAHIFACVCSYAVHTKSSVVAPQKDAAYYSKWYKIIQRVLQVNMKHWLAISDMYTE